MTEISEADSLLKEYMEYGKTYDMDDIHSYIYSSQEFCHLSIGDVSDLILSIISSGLLYLTSDSKLMYT